MAKHFKVNVTIKKRPLDQPIHYKVDGGRFESEKTIKLNINCKYAMELTFRPPQTLQSVNINGANVTVTERQREDDFVTYRAALGTAGMDKDKKGNRSSLHVTSAIRGVGELKMKLQCKFYPETELQHACWGQVCNAIDYECKVTENSMFVEILKETFR